MSCPNVGQMHWQASKALTSIHAMRSQQATQQALIAQRGTGGVPRRQQVQRPDLQFEVASRVFVQQLNNLAVPAAHVRQSFAQLMLVREKSTPGGAAKRSHVQAIAGAGNGAMQPVSGVRFVKDAHLQGKNPNWKGILEDCLKNSGLKLVQGETYEYSTQEVGPGSFIGMVALHALARAGEQAPMYQSEAGPSSKLAQQGAARYAVIDMYPAAAAEAEAAMSRGSPDEAGEPAAKKQKVGLADLDPKAMLNHMLTLILERDPVKGELTFFQLEVEGGWKSTVTFTPLVATLANILINHTGEPAATKKQADHSAALNAAESLRSRAEPLEAARLEAKKVKDREKLFALKAAHKEKKVLAAAEAAT